MEEVDIDQIFHLRSGGVGFNCLLLSLENCTPCDRALEILQASDRINGYRCKVSRDDRRALGKLLMKNIVTFPHIEFYSRGTLHSVVKGALDKADVEDVIEELSRSKDHE